MIATGALAIGYLLLNVFPENATSITGDACTALFGSASIIGISLSDVILSAVLAAVLLALFIIFYNKIFAVTFDESFAAASGTKVSIYNTVLAAVTGAVIVIAMNMVGALLISALITFPALSAMRLFKSLKRLVICSVVISVSCALIGAVLCILLSTPVGATVAVVDLTVFVIATVIGMIKNR
jgi:zinc transport system permease protein